MKIAILVLGLGLFLEACKEPPKVVRDHATDAYVEFQDEQTGITNPGKPEELDVATPAPPPPPSTADVNQQAQAMEILNKNCAACHNPGNAQGNFGTISNLAEMIASGRYVVPGEPEKSALIAKLAPVGNMPPAGSLKKEEIDLLTKWVKDLKPVSVKPIKEAEIVALISKDLQGNVTAGQRSSVRYFSLHVPYNVGSNPATLEILRQAFKKVLNSLSKAPFMVDPVAIDNARLIFRVQLPDLGMSVENFESVIASFYPFGQTFVPVAADAITKKSADDHQFLKTQIGTERYLIRADWFVATASLPNVYEKFLQLGADQNSLQTQLGVNLTQNIVQDKVIRAGFKNSNVSSQNRMIERHVQSNGLPYWVSYDFAANEGQASIFALPLGPVGTGNDDKAFVHDGGEMIFMLPNGLFAYYLATAAGARIDKGPTSIVRQADAPAQFLSAVVNGVSCMNCHNAGLLYKADEVRAFAEAQANGFSPAQLDKIRNLYADSKTFKGFFDKDNVLYFKALNSIGVNPSMPDPVNQAYRFYNRGLNPTDVREELGMSEREFAKLMTVEPFRTQWSSLFSGMGFIKRDEMQTHLQEALETYKEAAQPVNPLVGDAVITPQCMFANALSTAGCLLRQPPPPPPPPAPPAAP